MWEKHKTAILSCVLFVSLALNVGLVSWMEGKRAVEADARRERVIGQLGSTLQGLPLDKRDAAESIIKKYHKQIRERAEELRAQRQDLRKLISDPNVDPVILKAAFADIRAKTEKMQELNQNMLIELLPYIPVDARMALLARPRPVKRDMRDREPPQPIN